MQKPAVAPAERLEPVTFEDLVVAIGKTRNRDAFIRVFEYFAPRVKSFLMKGGSPPDQAEEIAQETMLSVWQKAESFDPRVATASTWIFTIARNKRIDMLRKITRPEPDGNDPLMIDSAIPLQPDDVLRKREEAKRIADVLQTLPEEQALLIQKSFFEDKTHSDIAAETNLPLGTVKSRIRLAVNRIRQNLGESLS